LIYIFIFLDIYGSTPEDAYEVDLVTEFLVDIMKDAAVLFGQDEEAKNTYWTVKAVSHLNILNKLLERNEGPFILGNTVHFFFEEKDYENKKF